MTKEQRKQAPKEIVINIGEGDNAVKVHCYTVYGLSLTMPGRGGRGKLSTDYISKALRKSPPLPSVEYAGMRVFPKDKEFLKKVMAWILNDKTYAQEKAEMNAAYLEQLRAQK